MTVVRIFEMAILFKKLVAQTQCMHWELVGPVVSCYTFPDGAKLDFHWSGAWGWIGKNVNQLKTVTLHLATEDGTQEGELVILSHNAFDPRGQDGAILATFSLVRPKEDAHSQIFERLREIQLQEDLISQFRVAYIDFVAGNLVQQQKSQVVIDAIRNGFEERVRREDQWINWLLGADIDPLK